MLYFIDLSIIFLCIPKILMSFYACFNDESKWYGAKLAAVAFIVLLLFNCSWGLLVAAKYTLENGYYVKYKHVCMRYLL